MIWSGLLIYWANDVYRIGWNETTLVHFFPDWMNNRLGLHHKLAEGMGWHFFMMWIFAINGVSYVLYLLISGEWRVIVPNRHTWKEALQVTLHDLGLSKNAPPKRKFNGAQQIAYTAILVMAGGSLLTGLAIYRPVQLAWLTEALGGYQAARLEHFLLMMGFLVFFAVHVLQVVRAGWNNFRAMVAGFEVGEKK
jgi:thiosulfate reductase cytochrome b subunit